MSGNVSNHFNKLRRDARGLRCEWSSERSAYASAIFATDLNKLDLHLAAVTGLEDYFVRVTI